jgi:hypothetical protein
MFRCEIVADSLSPQGLRLTSFLVTLPRIILAELNTHRMFSRNSASSRAIPFNRMVKAVEENPFIPIAWQKDHSGMQGTEYLDTEERHHGIFLYEHGFSTGYGNIKDSWKTASGYAIKAALQLHEQGVTKQLCNRLLEPFMWHTVLITTGKEGLDNFFDLRCPSYNVPVLSLATKDGSAFRSKKDAIKMFPQTKEFSELDWLKCNESQAEIHIQKIAEMMWDSYNSSAPKRLQAGQWHIPFEDKIVLPSPIPIEEDYTLEEGVNIQKVKISTAMAARTSYTVVGDEKEVSYETLLGIHDRIINAKPLHASPMEHCAKAMNDDEYNSYVKGTARLQAIKGQMFDNITVLGLESRGWCRNYRGFIQYRHIVENR